MHVLVVRCVVSTPQPGATAASAPDDGVLPETARRRLLRRYTPPSSPHSALRSRTVGLSVYAPSTILNASRRVAGRRRWSQLGFLLRASHGMRKGTRARCYMAVVAAPSHLPVRSPSAIVRGSRLQLLCSVHSAKDSASTERMNERRVNKALYMRSF